MHMREAIDKLMADFNKFVEEHAVFNGWVHSIPFYQPKKLIYREQRGSSELV